TKADHLHHTSHDRLEGILRLIADKAMARAAFAGAEVKVMALAALRATREAEARSGRQRLPCIVGVPLPGERLGGKLFDGKAEAAYARRSGAAGAALGDGARLRARRRGAAGRRRLVRTPRLRRPGARGLDRLDRAGAAAGRRVCRADAATARADRLLAPRPPQ